MKKLKLNSILLIIIGSLLIFISFISNHNSKIELIIESKNNLVEVLHDSIKYEKDKYNRVVASKQAITIEIKELKKVNDKLLSENQKLLKTNLNKKDKVGVQIKEVIEVDSLHSISNEKFISITEDKNTIKVKVVNSNPAFVTEDIDAVFQKDKPKFYNRKWFKMVIFTAGVVTGGLIMKK